MKNELNILILDSDREDTFRIENCLEVYDLKHAETTFRTTVYPSLDYSIKSNMPSYDLVFVDYETILRNNYRISNFLTNLNRKLDIVVLISYPDVDKMNAFLDLLNKTEKCNIIGHLMMKNYTFALTRFLIGEFVHSVSHSYENG